MSSPPSNDSTSLPRERQIAPLPLRPKRRSPRPSNSQRNASSLHQDLPHNDTTATRLSSFSFADSHLFSPPAPAPAPAPSAPQIGFNFGQTTTNPHLEGPRDDFTFRTLHNITPRPSLEPERIPLSSSPDPQPGPRYSSLPILSTSDFESPQPLHTLYSDEKIAVGGADYVSPSSVTEGFSGSPAVAGAASPPPLLTTSQSLDLSPSPGLRPRSVSDTSILSDVSDNNDAPIPYNVGDEQAPPEPFFEPTFQAALRQGLGIVKNTVASIHKVVGSSGAREDLERLLQDGKTLSVFQGSDTRTIAVLGDSGEGKSSLINSLLDFPEIAKTGDSGEACTSVVTEYRQMNKDHTAPITIEVEYFSNSEIEDHIKELVWNYRQMFLPSLGDAGMGNNEHVRIQRESEQAWSALEAAFRHQKSFTKELLISNMSEEGLAKATDQLIQWAHDLQWPDGGSSGVFKKTANTAEECCNETGKFMEDRYWPFTKIIRVYLGAQVLKTGIVLADLPGLQDTNLARVRATQTYLMKSDHIFIVTKISRAITDQSLKSSLYTVLSRHAPLEWKESGGKSLNVAVICTKSEEINETTARRKFCGPNNRISQQKMDQLDKAIEDAKRRRDKTLKKQLKREQESLLIDARNSHVKEGLRKAYSSEVPGGQLEVFCVSNTRYEKYSRKGNSEMVQNSGIPELRRFCHTITASAQLLEAKHFLQTTLSSLLNSLELWAGSSPAPPQPEDSEPDESIYEMLTDVKLELSRIIDQSQEGFNETFRDLILILLEKRNDIWEDAAKKKGQEWVEKWRWNTYKAWCVRDGKHQTLKLGHVNWNTDIIWKMRTELAFQWETLEEDIPTVFDELLQAIIQQLLKLKSYLKDEAIFSLFDGIDFRIQDVTYKFNRAQEEFVREVRFIRRSASEPTEVSYILTEMIPAYRSASQQSGDGTKARQIADVQGRITNGTLFPNISTAIKRDMKALIKKTFDGLENIVDVVLACIEDDIDIVFASRPRNLSADESNVNEEERRRKEELARAVRELKREHEELLANIANV